MRVMDQVVVGGGIVGWAAALDLLERDPGRRVLLVDDARPGRATAAGAGIITPFTRRDMGTDWTRLMFRSMRTYEELIPRLRDRGLQPGHEVVGKLLVASDAEQAAELHEVMERAQARIVSFGSVGIGEPTLLPGGEVARLHPLLAPVAGALLLPQVAQVDGRLLTAALRARARALGAQERHGRADLLVRGEGVQGVRLEGQRVAAGSVIVAAGVWTDELLAPLGISAGVRPQRGQIVHARTEAATPLPIAGGFDPTYLLGFSGGRLVLGPTREDVADPQTAPTLGGLHEMLERAHRLAPGLADARWHEVRTGVRPMSRDGVPTLGSCAPGLVVATGLGAQGLTVGPHVGAWAAQIADGVAQPVPRAFSPLRWATTGS